MTTPPVESPVRSRPPTGLWRRRQAWVGEQTFEVLTTESLSALEFTGRTTLGRLAAYSSVPETGVIDPFLTSQWDAPTGVTLSLSSGLLVSSGNFTARYITNNVIANRSDVFIQDTVAASSLAGVGPAARVVAAAVPDTAVGPRTPAGFAGTEQLIEISAGSTVQTDSNGSVTRTPPFRVAFEVIGAVARAQVAAFAEMNLSGVGLASGRVALYHSGSASTVARRSSVFVMRRAAIEAVGLPDDYTIEVLTAGDVVLGTATSSAGSASVDGFAFVFPAPRKLRIKNQAGTEVMVITPTDAVWGGDVYTFAVVADPTEYDVITTEGGTPLGREPGIWL